LLGLAGAAGAFPNPLDGRDAWPTIANGAPSPHDAILLNTAPRGGALRSGRFKLVVKRRPRASGGGLHAELFDVAQDPAEQVDVAAEHPETVKALRARYDAFARAAAPRKTSPTPEHFASPAVWGESE
jgi:arylsulfatase A-like enzyme